MEDNNTQIRNQIISRNLENVKNNYNSNNNFYNQNNNSNQNTKVNDTNNIPNLKNENNPIKYTCTVDYSISNLSNELTINEKLIILLLDKYNLNPFSSLRVKDVARDLGMNPNSANSLFDRSDFPSIKGKRPKQVMVLAYYLWKMGGDKIGTR